EADLTYTVIQRLQAIPAITAAHRRDCVRAKPYLTFKTGMKIRVWKNPVQVHHVFIENPLGICVFCGFVGWQHTQDLYRTLNQIAEEFQEHLIES
ncbi:MAG: lysophospholipase, partial [Chroococcales cyanobacterium]